MFEQQILCHQLPNSFNSMVNQNGDEKQSTNKETDKTVQALKRRILNAKLEQYESDLQQYAQLYNRELTKLEFETCNMSSLHQIGLIGQIMYDVKLYVHQHTKLFLRQIRYKESCFHAKLLRQHRQSSRVNKAVDVYPQIIVDVPHVSLNAHQLDYLSRAGQFA